MPAALAAVNYRHAYHAGNFADCVKHALLVWMIGAMRRKDKPFLILDTHAGVGRYRLDEAPAARTGEWREGIAKVVAARPPALCDFLEIVDRLGLYPGSPAIAAALLRPADRLICCELHPEDAAALRAAMRGAGVAVHERDGYAALAAFLPPAERRALVLIDPPYERRDEAALAVAALAGAHARFPAGVMALWYPIKGRAPVRELWEAMRGTGIRDVVAAEFWRRPPLDPARLNGCGLLVVNPPFGFEPAATAILAALADTLAEPGGGAAVERVADE